ncbi:MAG TPA: NUDIX hydrolase [Fibrobacteria bacterium]|nr:NUDIX hydrolase [Fibrobacteria bacterium]
MDGSPRPHDRIGPWIRLSGREIYDNPWIRVREDQVLHPDGSRGIYGTVHFKNTAIGVVPLDAQGRVILVGQHRYPFDRYFWELPEGGCLIGSETPESSAARELREETGYTAARWDYLGEVVLSNSTTDEAGHLFLARDLTPGPPHLDPSEQIEVKQVDFREAFRMAMEGEITESLSIIGLARARHFLEREAFRNGGPRPAPDREGPP